MHRVSGVKPKLMAHSQRSLSMSIQQARPAHQQSILSLQPIQSKDKPRAKLVQNDLPADDSIVSHGVRRNFQKRAQASTSEDELMQASSKLSFKYVVPLNRQEAARPI